ncbi:MAG: M20 family metallopeptidase [Planctomycetota bacterium]
MTDIGEHIEAVLPAVVDLRHALHAHPELGFEERQTARRVLDRLEAIDNLRIQTGVAGTGIVATLNAHKPGPCVALRADMDALPIQEENDLPYASKIPGRMHACGHDGHMSCLVGAAEVLARIADDLPGKVKFIFQPAEEGGGGGRAMCKAGVLEEPKVDAIFALHGWPDLPFGTVGTRPGAILASQDRWSITIYGKGAHAAWPHHGIDPIVAASQVVTTLQTIVSRSTDPLDSVVVTVGRFHAGTAGNIIPDSAELEGTIRALNESSRAKSISLIEQIAEQTALAFSARADVQIQPGYPVLVNDEHAADLVQQTAREALGPDKVVEGFPPCMGAEDFAFYAERIPAAFWCLGVGRGEVDTRPQLHQTNFDFPDDALPIGIRMHCELATRFLAAPAR